LKELNDAREKKEKLELQVKHVTEMLKNEIQIRQRVQREERELVSKSRNFFFLNHCLPTTYACMF